MQMCLTAQSHGWTFNVAKLRYSATFVHPQFPRISKVAVLSNFDRIHSLVTVHINCNELLRTTFSVYNVSKSPVSPGLVQHIMPYHI